jgi:hypothetical protein
MQYAFPERGNADALACPLCGRPPHTGHTATPPNAAALWFWAEPSSPALTPCARGDRGAGTRVRSELELAWPR